MVFKTAHSSAPVQVMSQRLQLLWGIRAATWASRRKSERNTPVTSTIVKDRSCRLNKKKKGVRVICQWLQILWGIGAEKQKEWCERSRHGSLTDHLVERATYTPTNKHSQLTVLLIGSAIRNFAKEAWKLLHGAFFSFLSLQGSQWWLLPSCPAECPGLHLPQPVWWSHCGHPGGRSSQEE